MFKKASYNLQASLNFNKEISLFAVLNLYTNAANLIVLFLKCLEKIKEDRKKTW